MDTKNFLDWILDVIFGNWTVVYVLSILTAFIVTYQIDSIFSLSWWGNGIIFFISSLAGLFVFYGTLQLILLILYHCKFGCLMKPSNKCPDHDKD